MKSQCEKIIHAQRALRVKMRLKNDLHAQARELNYMLYIQYVTKMIVNTAIVYVVGPRNTFVIHHREVNEITVREINHVQRTLSNEDEANESLDVDCDFDVIERRFRYKIKHVVDIERE